MAIVRITKDRRLANKRFGARLARIRRERGVTQVELADLLGVGQPVVSHYERGRATVDTHVLAQLAKILEVPADELLGLTDQPTENGSRALRPFLRRLRHVDRLAERDQRALLRTIDAFLKSAPVDAPALPSSRRQRSPRGAN